MATNTPDRASSGSPTMFTIPRKPANTTTTALSRGMTAGEDAMLSELQKLVALSSQNPIANQELFSFKANTLLQFLGILAATVFGVFSILAWLAAAKSNEISTNALNQALQSNQLALLAYCVSGGNNVRRRPHYLTHGYTCWLISVLIDECRCNMYQRLEPGLWGGCSDCRECSTECPDQSDYYGSYQLTIVAIYRTCDDL
jgi:hypothetical protein